ncbi:MAG TPA: PLP-dependent aminotransferase family protein [Vicinamibacterales bacterium]|nr:PLP-dependent aminotransferase family protein [Vicinamibacterales bacterium]
MTDYERFLSATGRQLAGSAIRQMGILVSQAPDMVSFAPGYPDPELFPWDELRAIADSLLRGDDGDTLQYGPTRGHMPLVETLVDVLEARGIKTVRENVIITSGSQQGIDLIARVIISPGDVVLVELPTFTGGIAAFKNAQANIVGVKLEADGISLDHLDEVWQREHRAGHTVKLLYIIPNFQNPTGSLLALDKRRRLLEWAERRDVLIVEDDPYGSLYFEDVASAAETRPIAADDTNGRVLYLSTVSKTLAPGFRVGWMAAPRVLVDRFDTAKQSTDLSSGVLDQHIAFEAIRRGVIDRLAPTLRAAYRRKRDVIERAIRTHIGDRLSWESPKGGFFVWATLPEGRRDLDVLRLALDQGVVFVIGSAFFVDGSGHQTIRLSFSAPSVDRIEEGVKRLATVLQPALTSS